jgi:hypothetical protein
MMIDIIRLPMFRPTPLESLRVISRHYLLFLLLFLRVVSCRRLGIEVVSVDERLERDFLRWTLKRTLRSPPPVTFPLEGLLGELLLLPLTRGSDEEGRRVGGSGMGRRRTGGRTAPSGPGEVER